MIKNRKQYLASKTQVDRLNDTLTLSRDHHVEMDSRIYEAMIAGIESQLQDIQQEIGEYEKLEQDKELPVGTLDSIGILLIKARIACEYTQKVLAERVGCKEQQIQKYESEEYRTASLERLNVVMEALGYRAIVELANCSNFHFNPGVAATWDMESLGTDDQEPAVTYGSKWSAEITLESAQWRTFSISSGEAA